MKNLIDEEGENRAVRMFLALYGGHCGVTTEQMRKHLEMSGFKGAWPLWATADGHLTKAGAQLWIRHLFSLEPAREWIGLTDEEIDKLQEEHSSGRGAVWRFNFKGFARAIEAKLKEKNK